MNYRTCCHCKRELPETKEFFNTGYGKFKPYCKECQSVYRKQHYQKNKEHARQYRRNYYYENQEEQKAYTRLYYWNDPEAARQAQRDYRAKNPELHKAQVKQYRHDNPERKRQWDKNRQEREKNQRCNHSEHCFRDTVELLADVCVWCGTTENLETDHATPLVAGGLHCGGNLQILCRPCNSTKGAAVLDDPTQPPQR